MYNKGKAGTPENSVGAAWKNKVKTGKNAGMEFISLKLKLDNRHDIDLSNVSLVMFPNKNKKAETHPDFSVLLSTVKADAKPLTGRPKSAFVPKPKEAPVKDLETALEDAGDDVF